MLTLSRKIGERLYIGDHAVITVVDVRGKRVVFEIEALTGVAIHTEETILPALEARRKAEGGDRGN